MSEGHGTVELGGDVKRSVKAWVIINPGGMVLDLGKTRDDAERVFKLWGGRRVLRCEVRFDDGKPAKRSKKAKGER